MRENDLDSVAGIQVGEFRKTRVPGKSSQAFVPPGPWQREARQGIAAVLAPGNSDDAQFFQHADKALQRQPGWLKAPRLGIGPRELSPECHSRSAAMHTQCGTRYTGSTVSYNNYRQHWNQE